MINHLCASIKFWPLRFFASTSARGSRFCSGSSHLQARIRYQILEILRILPAPRGSRFLSAVGHADPVGAPKCGLLMVDEQAGQLCTTFLSSVRNLSTKLACLVQVEAVFFNLWRHLHKLLADLIACGKLENTGRNIGEKTFATIATTA